MKVRSAVDPLLKATFFALAKGADTPVSLSCWLMFKYGEFEQLARKDIDPHSYNSQTEFARDYQMVKFLSKNKFLPTGIDTDRVASLAWYAAESQCREANKRLREARLRGSNPRVESVLFTAKRKIARLLGECKLTRALDGCKWGPGSTFTLRGDDVTWSDKTREFPVHVTLSAQPLLRAVIESDPHWYYSLTGMMPDGPFSMLPSCFAIAEGCRATLVDKNAKTKRSIAIEPTGNIFLQLGIGRYIRHRLKHVSIDLDDQTRNQDLARWGAITGALATLDLASASDTVSREIVYDLLPLDWFLLLDQVRSPKLLWNGEAEFIKLEKFSSMGNGFTFELESLIFWSLASACAEVMGTEDLTGVYGDDIVVPTEVCPLLIEVLGFCGFTLNTEKSYESSYFRESCGKHYWGAAEVTPAYQKDIPLDLPRLYRLANRLLRRASHVVGDRLQAESWVRPAWLCAIAGLRDYLRRHSRNRHFAVATESDVLYEIALLGGHAIPLGDESDDGLMLGFSDLRWFIIDSDENGLIKLPVLAFRPAHKFVDGVSLLAYWLRFSPEVAFKGRTPVRRRGIWETRRRWFSALSFNPLSACDVEWTN